MKKIKSSFLLLIMLFVAACGTSAEDEEQGSGDFLDELYAPSLHEGITPADPGTAYFEITGQRFDFTEVVCTIRDEPGAQRFRVDATGDTEGAGHLLYIDRQIGENIGWNWEDELVQFAQRLPQENEDDPAMWHSSMIQHERPRNGAVQWDHGGGASPVIRVVGDQATATGTMTAMMFHNQAFEGEFIATATCP